MASTVSMACWTTSASATTPTLSPSRVTEYAGVYSVVMVNATARAPEQARKVTGPAARLPATTLWNWWVIRRPWMRPHSRSARR